MAKSRIVVESLYTWYSWVPKMSLYFAAAAWRASGKTEPKLEFAMAKPPLNVLKPRSQLREMAGMMVWITAIVCATAALRSWMLTDGTDPAKAKTDSSEKLN